MKNKIGNIAGFLMGIISFLILYKILFLSKVPPTDELAPGIVLIMAIGMGIFMSYIGGIIQERVRT